MNDVLVIWVVWTYICVVIRLESQRNIIFLLETSKNRIESSILAIAAYLLGILSIWLAVPLIVSLKII